MRSAGGSGVVERVSIWVGGWVGVRGRHDHSGPLGLMDPHLDPPPHVMAAGVLWWLLRQVAAAAVWLGGGGV